MIVPSKGFNTVKKGVEEGANQTKDGVQTGFDKTKDGLNIAFHETEKGVNVGLNQADHALTLAANELTKGFTDMGDIAINLPRLSQKLGKKLIAVPGMLNKMSGGMLAPVVKAFLQNYWDYLRVGDYVARGIITGNSTYFHKALVTGEKILVNRVKTIESLAEGVADGKPSAIEAVALMAFGSGLGTGHEFSNSLLQGIQKGVKGYEEMKMYAIRLQSIKEITEDVIHKDYKSAALTGASWARQEYDYHQGQQDEEQSGKGDLDD